jgi:hypothetical protein
MFAAATLISCNDKPAATAATAGSATSASPAEPAVVAKACASVEAALAKLPAPQIVQAAKVAWPPPFGAACHFNPIEDLNSDGQQDVQVACDPGTGEEAMGELAFRLYATTADGCLVDVGQLAGVEWHPAAANPAIPAVVAGFRTLEARGAGVEEDVGVSVETITYKYDPATKQYAVAERHDDLVGDPTSDVEPADPKAKPAGKKREITANSVGKVTIGMAGKTVLAMKGAKKRKPTCACAYDVVLRKLRISVGEDNKVCEIAVADPSYKLASGIGIGSTLQEVTQALGAPVEEPATGALRAGGFSLGFSASPPRPDSKVTALSVGGCGE